MHVNVSGLLRNFAKVRRAALAGETVVITTREGNLVLAAQPQVGDPLLGAAAHGTSGCDADLDTVARPRATTGGRVAPPGEPRPAGPRRFVSRTAVADSARRAPRIDAEQFRADVDVLFYPRNDG